jgi:hypothetical protein
VIIIEKDTSQGITKQKTDKEITALNTYTTIRDTKEQED